MSISFKEVVVGISTIDKVLEADHQLMTLT